MLVELVYDPAERRTAFVVWENDGWRVENGVNVNTGEHLVPYSPRNNLIKNEVVLLPSRPEEYGSEEELIREIQAFIHRYVDISPRFERVASYYVLFSWVYDNFSELPYLRLRGDYGSGKTRFLLTAGSLCYKPIFASGATSVSPIFRILDAFRGTLIIDEGDFRWSDEKADIVKILNNGNVKGLPVLRTEVSGNREFNPRAFQVFGPKIIASRGMFLDKALESRFITEEMGDLPLRKDIPINLHPSYRDEALRLRNKLLLYRFRNFGTQSADPRLIDPTIEPRLNQIFVPLMSVTTDGAVRRELKAVARSYQQELIMLRGLETEAQVLEVVRDLDRTLKRPALSIGEITKTFLARYGDEYDRRVTNKWIGTVLRKSLHVKTRKSGGVFVIPLSERPKLERLYEKYGLSEETEDAETEREPGSDELPAVDVGDVRDIAQGEREGESQLSFSI